MNWWQRPFKPLQSRKVRVALATVIAAWALEYGLAVSEEVLFTILGVGVAVILGIAHEDAGRKSARNVTIVPPADRAGGNGEGSGGK